MEIKYSVGTASETAIYSHLNKCNEDFIPPLDKKVNIQVYATKIFKKSVTFEAWDGEIMIGLVAAYFNDFEGKTSYITNVSTIGEYRGKGIATNLLKNCIAYARQKKNKCICLEVEKSNHYAVNFYKKMGFQVHEDKDILLLMQHDI